MNSLLGALALILGLSAASIQGVDMKGQWQGVLQSKPKEVRLILRLEDHGQGMQCAVYAIEVGPEVQACQNLTLEGDVIRFAVPSAGGRFEGKLTPDRLAIEGSVTGPNGGTVRLARASAQDAWVPDPAPHKQSFLTTSDGVRLEVLDFGGSGPPLLFISGLGATAHAFDAFAPRFTNKHHVYSVTRRGYGESGKPEPSPATYGSRRLGDDVLEVMDQLKLQKPILAGWSAGGIELGSVASRRPERVAGVVYLDAAYAYSFYAPGNAIPLGNNTLIALNDLTSKVRSISTVGSQEGPVLIDEILNTIIPELEGDLRAAQQRLRTGPTTPPTATPTAPPPLAARISTSVTDNVEKFRTLPVPVLAIYATSEPSGATPAALEQSRRQAQFSRELIDRYKAGNPKAKVVEILGGQHAIFRSHTDQVEREMNAFFQGLSPN